MKEMGMIKVITTTQELEEAGKLVRDNPDLFQIKCQIINKKVEYYLFVDSPGRVAGIPSACPLAN